jgi:hypothetical protein
MRKINGTINREGNKPEWVTFNPYAILGKEPKEFTARDLFMGEIITDENGNFAKIVEFGSGAFFGKDSYSFMEIKMRRLKHKQNNPNRFYISINTHNPKEVYHRTPERPEGSKYGGVGFGGWYNSVEECVDSFPNEHRKKSTGSLYWNKTLKITDIKITDLETGGVKNIKPTSKHNKILNSLKFKRTNGKKTQKKKVQ